MGRRSLLAEIAALEGDQQVNRQQLEKRLRPWSAQQVCDGLLVRLERPNLPRAAANWISRTLMELAPRRLDLTRARRIAYDERAPLLNRALALEALDASSPMSDPPRREGDEVELEWLHWSVASYHQRKATFEAEIAHLRLAPVLLATELCVLRVGPSAGCFIQEMFESHDNDELRTEVWTDLEACRVALEIEPQLVYSGLSDAPHLLGTPTHASLTVLLEARSTTRH